MPPEIPPVLHTPITRTPPCESRAAAIRSFAPAARPDAARLIVGSMPGTASLEAGQYYAHPRNLFRPLIEDLFAVKNRPLSYCQLLALLADRKIALWDVLQSCVRAGSLDSAITGEIPNDFAAFFAAHPRITHIYFNGKKAAQSFQKFVDPHCVPAAITQTVLPSTSPANASLSYDHKRKAWAALLTD